MLNRKQNLKGRYGWVQFQAVDSVFSHTILSPTILSKIILSKTILPKTILSVYHFVLEPFERHDDKSPNS